MFGIRKYAFYLSLLAATCCLSCRRAQEAPAETGSTATTAGSTAHGAQVPANTVLWVQLQKDLDSAKLKAGDHFKGQVAEDIIVEGKTVIAKGSTVEGRVTNAESAQQQGQAGLLSLVVDTVSVNGRSKKVETNFVTLEGHPAPDKSPTPAQNAFIPKKGLLQFFFLKPLDL